MKAAKKVNKLGGKSNRNDQIPGTKCIVLLAESVVFLGILLALFLFFLVFLLLLLFFLLLFLLFFLLLFPVIFVFLLLFLILLRNLPLESLVIN